MQKWLVTLLVIVSSLGTAYFYRFEIILYGVHWQLAKTPVSTHHEIAWSTPSFPVAPRQVTEKPNIILIVADDLGWNDLTLNGGGVAGGIVPTPNIDSIARDGALFTNGYFASGTCAPSRASLMTGKYPTRFGFEFTPAPGSLIRVSTMMSEATNDSPYHSVMHEYEDHENPDFEASGLSTEEVTISERLQAAGYYTAHIGKWHLGRTNGMAPIDQGFDDSLLMASGLYLPEDDPDAVNSKQAWDPIDRFQWAAYQYAASFNTPNRFLPDGYITDYWTNEAVKVIESNKERPFFLYLAHWAIHTPLQALKSDYDALSNIEDHRLRVYAAMVHSLDRSVGRVLEALKDNGLEENTIVIFTSDNGGPSYIGLPNINTPYRGWKLSFFEGGIHVPYFIKWPGQVPAGTVNDNPVHHFDIAASALAVADINDADDLNGVNLLPFITNDEFDRQLHEALFWRSGHYQVALSEGWKMHRNKHTEKVWLFDLSNDPTEQNNLASFHPDRIRDLDKLLAKHNTKQVEPR